MINQYYCPDSYKESRELFLNELSGIKSKWTSANRSSRIVDAAEDLTIDLISADSINKNNLIIISTGLHGIEGYLGSIMLQLFVKEFLPLLDAANTGILLIHCINPSGMQQHYRTNRANVDLNRNFISDFSRMKKSNKDYSKMNGFFNPQYPLHNEMLSRFVFLLQTLKWMLLAGPKGVRNAALMGQYEFPSGMYFGGQELQVETKYMMALFREWIPRYQNTLHLDMHSGYGPRYQMTLVQSSKETLTSREAQSIFSIPKVTSSDSDEFYKMNGEMSDFIYLVGSESNTNVYSAAFEFGTYGEGILNEARSLLTTIAANQSTQSLNNSGIQDWVKKDYDELYFPSERTWIQKAIENGRDGFNGILLAKGLI